MLATLAVSACHSGSPAKPQIELVAPPPATSPAAEHYPGLHNVVTYAPGAVCGGVPEGKEGLHSLFAMGIKTIVSVDGATPDVETAAQLGMRYVHLPISYDTVTAKRQRELAQAISSCEGPIYMHCHHGKHRSAAALASALVLAGKLTPDAAVERMQVSGTAKDYTGLWQAVRNAQPMPKEALTVDASQFPSISTVSGMVATMAAIDQVIDLVRQSHAARWQPPGDHPDLVAEKETQRLHSLFSALADDPESKQRPTDYQQILQRSITSSEGLDRAVRGRQFADAERHLSAINKSCKECHVKYRDQ